MFNDLENNKEFPSRIKYFKNYILDNFPVLFIIEFMFILGATDFKGIFILLSFNIIYFIIILTYFYNLDYKIYDIFKKKKILN